MRILNDWDEEGITVAIKDDVRKSDSDFDVFPFVMRLGNTEVELTFEELDRLVGLGASALQDISIREEAYGRG